MAAKFVQFQKVFIPVGEVLTCCGRNSQGLGDCFTTFSNNKYFRHKI